MVKKSRQKLPLLPGFFVFSLDMNFVRRGRFYIRPR